MDNLSDKTNEITLEEQNKVYDQLITMLSEAKGNNTPIDEGLGKAIIGGLVGISAGPAIMKGVAKVLGIQENGALYNLMTSKLIITALASYLGWKN